MGASLRPLTEPVSDSRPVAAQGSCCQICRKSLPPGAALCTECESWQFNQRAVTLAAKFALVLLVPLAAWAITVLYQRHEEIKASTVAAISRTADELAEVLQMNKDFQVAFDTLATGCGKDGLGAPNLCVAEYVTRLIRINQLVADLSWRSSALPLPENARDTLRQWQALWWGSSGTKGIGGRLESAVTEMARQGTLLPCQELDFGASACGSQLQAQLGPFRQQTNTALCAISLDLRRHTLEMYESQRNSPATQTLIQRMKGYLKDSYCSNLLQQSRAPHAVATQ